jgi:archaetidylinositol phosphate synthase
MAQPVTASASFQPETRVQQSVLTALEKRALHWLAVRMPDGINSDHLTLLALFAMASVGASYWLSRYTPIGLVLATVWLAVNWFGDSLDGTLARVRAQQRPRYGYYVDHVVDVVGVLFLFAGLGLSGYLHPGVAAALLIAYFLLSLEIYLATHSLGRFRMSFFGVGPTELRLVLAAMNAALLVSDPAPIPGTPLTVLDAGALVGAAALVATFILSALRNTRELYRAEPMPARQIR